jgi:hypothetical protein
MRGRADVPHYIVAPFKIGSIRKPVGLRSSGVAQRPSCFSEEPLLREAGRCLQRLDGFARELQQSVTLVGILRAGIEELA